MRALIQRVSNAEVIISGKKHCKIGNGLLILLSVEKTDSLEDIAWLSGKICRLRIFPDDNQVMNYSVNQANSELLVVSQFTLHASTKKGNRPSYIRAASPEIAIPLYEKFIVQLSKDTSQEIASGIFGEMMDISLTNSGPVTIWIDTKNKE